MNHLVLPRAVLIIGASFAIAVSGCGGGSDSTSMSVLAPIIPIKLCGRQTAKLQAQHLKEARTLLKSHRSATKDAELHKELEAGYRLCASNLLLAGTHALLKGEAKREEMLEAVEEGAEARCEPWVEDKRAVMEELAKSKDGMAVAERLPEYRVLCEEEGLGE